MSENTNSMDWNKIAAIFSAAMVSLMFLISIFWGLINSKPSCGFVRLKISDAQDMIAAYQDDQLAADAVAKCKPEELWGCYNNMVKNRAGGDINVPMGTLWDDCKTYYDPYGLGLTFALETDANVEAALGDFMRQRGGMGIDDAIEAYFYGILAHERCHQQQCLEHAGKPGTLDESRQQEIEAYQVFIQYMEDQLVSMGCNEKTYCPCVDTANGKPRRYSSEIECSRECPSSLKCAGIQCTVPP